jgi:peroxiredoxin
MPLQRLSAIRQTNTNFHTTIFKDFLMRALLVICFALFATVSFANNDMMTPMTGVRTAPPIELPDSDGQPFNMEDYKGKYILVNFWAHWCGPCVKEFPAMQTLYDALKEDGFEIIAVHAGPPQGRVRPFLKKHNITFKTVLDADMSAHGWDVPVLPVSYLINPEGKLVYKALGPREWEIESMRALMTEK